MATNFFTDLWESIFTPGPTPSLLKATNISFACLQVVLLVLLIVTYSIHFVILSSLCGGLWWAVNWFAAELKAAEEREKKDKVRLARDAAVPGTDDSETEVETATAAGGKDKSVGGSGGSRSHEVEAVETRGELKHRVADVREISGTQSSVSTEDEWEKVSENENEKDK
jgi:hypothetical protein